MSTIRNENNEKYLILRKRYFTECPVEEEPEDDLQSYFGNPELLQSPGSRSGISEYDLVSGGQLFNELQSPTPLQSDLSPYKEPPPYKPPPKVILHAYKNQQKYGECVDEFKSALSAIGRRHNDSDDIDNDCAAAMSVNANYAAAAPELVPKLPPKSKPFKDDLNLSKQIAIEESAKESVNDGNEDKENIADLPVSTASADHMRTLDKQISVKEATKKFNKIASEEEASKITSPPAKKKPEKVNNSYFYY